METVVVGSEVSSVPSTTFSLLKGPGGPSGLYHSVKPQVLARQLSSAKPNYTYTDLITLALRDKTSLTVSEIYQWIRSAKSRSGENKKFDFPVKISHTFVRTMTGGRTVSATI